LAPKQRNLLILAVAIFIGVTAVYLSMKRRSVDPDAKLGLLNLGKNVAYVGNDTCRTCHPNIAATFDRSGMARSWSPASVERLSESHAQPNEVTDQKRNFHYRAFEVSGFFFQEEYRPDASGEKVHSLERPVSYVVGSGTRGLSFVAQHNGFLTLLPLGWYSEAAQWDLSPGYQRHNPRFERVVPIECVACHNSFPKHVAGSRNRYELPLPTGIGCEQCHGPGELHVAKQSQMGPADESSGAGDSTIVNPARLPIDRRDDVCLQCHLISDVAVLSPGKAWTDFRPGQRLKDMRNDLFLQQEDPTRVGFSSHATRMRLSRCWTEGTTRGELTCISCHDPHVAIGAVANETYVRACMECHAPPDCNRDRAGEPASIAENCIECHMRKGSPANVAHTMFTDHWIRARPEPLLPVDTSAPRTFDPNRPIKLIDFWENRESASPTLRALALAQYLDFNQIPDQRQAIDALQTALARDKENADLHFWLGVALAKQGNWRASLPHYETAARGRSDAITRFSLGEAQRNTGRLNDAVKTLRGTIDEFPDFLSSYREVAEAFVAMNDLPRAVEALDRSLARFPYQDEVRIRRAHLGYLAGESVTRVLEQIAEARRLQPDSASLLWLQGQCQADQGKTDEAIRSLEAALAVDERFLAALLSIGPLLAEEGRFEEARARLAQLRAVAPNHPMLPKAQLELDRASRSKR
jgi:tetratricopeptide (TPR) repeat protein